MFFLGRRGEGVVFLGRWSESRLSVCFFCRGLGVGWVAGCVVSRRVRVIRRLATRRALVLCCARVRLEVAGAFLVRWSIGHVPCDVQARFG